MALVMKAAMEVAMATTMAADTPTLDESYLRRVEDYAPLIGEAAVARILAKAKALGELHVVNINSTFYGGGVAEILTPLTLLMNSAGIKTGWRAIQGRLDFFSVTKKMHNALQGDDINLSAQKKRIYEEVVHENALRTHLDHDLVIVHDPQPLPIIRHYKKKSPWVWRCHVDLSNPNRALWDYLTPFIERYDAVIVSIPEYRQPVAPPMRFFMPAIDPFILKNRELTEAEIDERLAHYGIPTDRTLVTQVSRFDRWKDPKGVIEAFLIARREIDAVLVLLGNVATDDPEGQAVFSDLCACGHDDVIILSHQDTALVNALQRRSAVVLQKSLREGFGLTVTEAMWKGTPVIGGRVGGIPHQIEDGVNGFLVSTIEEAARRIVDLVENPGLRKKLGARARETVREKFLMSRLMEQYLDLFAGFEVSFRLRDGGGG